MSRLITTAVMLALLTGCASLVPASSVMMSSRDVHVKEKLSMISVTPVFEIQPLSEVRRNVKDTIDIIENEYAISSVRINRDGSFDHSLRSKPQKLECPMEVPVRTVDSTIVTAEKEVQTVYVEKKLTWWQQTLQICGWILIGAIVTWICIKVFGKGILTLIKH